MSTPKVPVTRYSDVISSVISSEGKWIQICYHIHTGRVVARAESGAPGGYHSGVLLGMDKYGCYWIAHHHAAHSKPVIETETDFCKGNRLMFDLRDVQFGALEVAARAVCQVLEANAYCARSYDSEDFVSLCIAAPQAAVSKASQENAVLLGLVSVFLGILT